MASSLKILQLSDLHILERSGDTMEGVDTEKSFNHVIEHAFDRYKQFDLIVISGDLAQDPCRASYLRIVESLERYSTKTVCLPGNHDDFSLMQQVIKSGQINCNRVSLFKDWVIVCLNSQKIGCSGGFISGSELEFLSVVCEQYSTQHILLAMHHHPIKTHSVWMDTMMIENHAALFSVLDSHRSVRGIIYGHVHQTQETVRHSKDSGLLRMLASPSTCFQFKPVSKIYALDTTSSGYRVLQLSSDGDINTTIHRLSS